MDLIPSEMDVKVNLNFTIYTAIPTHSIQVKKKILLSGAEELS